MERTCTIFFIGLTVALVALSACGPSDSRGEDVESFHNIGVAVTCYGCPEIYLEYPESHIIVDEQVYLFQGNVRGNPVSAVYRVYDGIHYYSGPIYVDPHGELGEWLPLFCDENLVEVYFSNRHGVTVWRQIVSPDYCPGIPRDVHDRACYN